MYKTISFLSVALLWVLSAPSTAVFGQKKSIDKKAMLQLVNQHKDAYTQGKVADYIPELGKANPKSVAFAITNENGETLSVGDHTQKFSIQSISKLIALMLAVEENGEEKVFAQMGYYGTNYPFNYFANLDQNGRPLNPMMNAGAIYTTSLIAGDADEPYQKILARIRYITNNPKIDINPTIYESEKSTGHRNRGMFYLMKNYGMIEKDEEALNNYFRQCSIEIDVEDLSKIGYFIAHQGTRYDGDKTHHNKDLMKLIQAQMLTAGMYEFSGEYTRTIALPSKSGVGGGIVATVPNKMGIAVYNPSLDEHGNSLVGYLILKDFVQKFSVGIF